mgnify:CR=1 FL=1
MVTEQERQAIVDSEHLRILPIVYWVLAALDIFISLYGLIYAGLGGMMVLLPWDEAAPDAPPPFFGWYFLALGVGFMVFFIGSGVLKILAGVWMRKRTHRAAILVAAGISCLSWPFGIIAGVFTFIVMARPSVAALFGAPVRAEAPAPLAPTPPAGEPAPASVDPAPAAESPAETP